MKTSKSGLPTLNAEDLKGYLNGVYQYSAIILGLAECLSQDQNGRYADSLVAAIIVFAEKACDISDTCKFKIEGANG